jgi:hypothetical protein
MNRKVDMAFIKRGDVQIMDIVSKDKEKTKKSVLESWDNIKDNASKEDKDTNTES